MATNVLLWSVLICAQAPASSHERDAVARIVTRMQRADYEGNRAALQDLYGELTPWGTHPELASRVYYWKGFALWRRALNGFNDAVDPADLERDLQQALREFEEASLRDEAFVDAHVGAISCLQTLTFLHSHEPSRVQELAPRFVRLLKEGVAAAPNNPRLLWVLGAGQWYSPPGLPISQVDERHANALATYEQGLHLARQQKGNVTDPLEPSWGEPELLMNLAWANLNQTTPNVSEAEDCAKQALALVPYWHYVRDVLMPQIRRAKDKQPIA